MSGPHLAVSYVNTLPQTFATDFADAVSADGLNLLVEPRESDGPYAGMEWLFPTAIIVYIAKSYFDGFLKEMGKDHYGLLKAGIKTFREKIAKTGAEPIVIGTPGKLRSERPYTLMFSVMAEAGSKIHFKLLIKSSASPEEFDQSVDAFLSFLDDLHTAALDASMVEKLNAAPVIGRMSLLTFNHDTREIETVNPLPDRLQSQEARPADSSRPADVA